MCTQCLICNSSVVLSKDAARSTALLVGALNGLLRGFQQSTVRQACTDHAYESPLEQAVETMINGVSVAASNWNSTQEFINDMQKYQFAEYRYLCLRCGARFDDPSAASP